MREISYKNNFPFRIGCTSYVIPDAIIPNVERMAPIVDDIEIVLFESLANLPDKSCIRELSKLTKSHNISYTVHLPIDKQVGSLGPIERGEFVSQLHAIYTLVKPLSPCAYILHLDGIHADSHDHQIEQWKKNVNELCTLFCNLHNINATEVCIENLGYNPILNDSIVKEFEFSYCVDMGHLWLHNYDWESCCRNVFDKTRVVHLHGVSQNRDHQSLTKHPKEQLVLFCKEMLSTYKGVLTIELFNERDTFESLELLRSLWAQLH